MERKVRRVQVTASVPGASEPVGQIAAPAESRTPTGMELKLAHGKCGWKRGDSANRDQQTTKMLLPFPPSLLYGSQPPVKAALRLASLGLDRTWLRSERNVLRGGNGRAWLGTREVEHTAVGAGQLCLQTTNSQIYS